ncbi:MAG: biotin/lipoyl-binding protein [Ruminococcaceae bacterium]|nr:biotin/lipoyl-binding protein [Oscillospiraceae bacterium]
MKYVVTLNGKNYEVEVTETDAIVTGVSQVPVMAAAPVAPVAAPAPVAAAEAPAEAPAAPAAPAAPTASGTQVKAPMPGTILAVKASAGQAVKAGDVIVVLEAMKMENDIVAPCDGTVKEIVVTKGATVNTDDVLAVI